MEAELQSYEVRDYSKIEKLLRLDNIKTFYDDVRKLVKNVHSDHSIKRWQCLAEIRYKQLIKESEE